MGQISKNVGDKSGNRRAPAQHQCVSVSLPSKTLEYLVAALKKQWKKYRKELKRCQKHFSTEAVHDSRVETRRLLSMIGLLSPFLVPGRAKKTHAFLKRHLDTFDALRDTQVQLEAVAKLKKRFLAAAAFYDYLRKQEKSLLRETRRNTNRIKTKRLGKLITACRKDAQKRRLEVSASNALLWRLLESRFARTQQLHDEIDAVNPKTIHCTRIAFKQFRYMIEILSQYVVPFDKRLLRAMHRYQTMMGQIQDADVLLSAWGKYLHRIGGRSKSARIFGKELLRARDRLIRLYLNTTDLLPGFSPEQALRRLRLDQKTKQSVPASGAFRA
jgi:CHAD domain-containing protein